MDTLQDFLNRQETQFFYPNEISEPLQLTYTIMKLALMHKCDSIKFTKNIIEWSFLGKQMGSYQLVHGRISLYNAMLQSFTVVLERDEIARRYFTLESSINSELIYRITY